MYFTTFNHDDDANDDTLYDGELCLICWEPHTTNNYIYKMKTAISIFSYHTSCTCNGKFHHDCLLKWIYMSQSCPICRIKIDIVDDNDEKLPLTFNVLKCFKIFIYLSKYLFFCFLLKTMFNIVYFLEKSVDENQCYPN